MKQDTKDKLKLLSYPTGTLLMGLVVIGYVYRDYGLFDILPPSAKWLVMLFVFLSPFSLLLYVSLRTYKQKKRFKQKEDAKRIEI